MAHRKFRTWLKDQINRDDPIGDLAIDTFAVSDKPDFKTKKEWLSYLRNRGACKEALEAFETAWKEFEKQS